MNKELYFIPIIEKAISSDSPQTNLIDAFSEIEILGKKKEFNEGFENFKLFMSEIIVNSERSQNSPPINKDVFKKRLEEFREIYQHLFEQQSSIHEQYDLIIKFIDQIIKATGLTETTNLIQIEKAYPGVYSIELSNGQVLWKKELDRTFLIEETPSKEEYLLAAAKTDIPKFEESLLGGDLKLKIIPGDSHGKIVIIVQNKENTKK